jgi:hypothetical protein
MDSDTGDLKYLAAGVAIHGLQGLLWQGATHKG